MGKLLAAAVLAAISINANAFPVEWTLNNFVFDDGGIATGGFTYDADTYELSNVSIVTSGGSLPGNTYDDGIAVGNTIGTIPLGQARKSNLSVSKQIAAVGS